MIRLRMVARVVAAVVLAYYAFLFIARYLGMNVHGLLFLGPILNYLGGAAVIALLAFQVASFFQLKTAK